jgi:hypothetical protein
VTDRGHTPAGPGYLICEGDGGRGLAAMHAGVACHTRRSMTGQSVALFFATFDKDIGVLARRYRNNPVHACAGHSAGWRQAREAAIAI